MKPMLRRGALVEEAEARAIAEGWREGDRRLRTPKKPMLRTGALAKAAEV